jgi:hypothetical protein
LDSAADSISRVRVFRKILWTGGACHSRKVSPILFFSPILAPQFIQSRSHNLKYLAITGLALIVEEHPQYAAQHQLAVLDCLEGTLLPRGHF